MPRTVLLFLSGHEIREALAGPPQQGESQMDHYVDRHDRYPSLELDQGRGTGRRVPLRRLGGPLDRPAPLLAAAQVRSLDDRRRWRADRHEWRQIRRGHS